MGWYGKENPANTKNDHCVVLMIMNTKLTCKHPFIHLPNGSSRFIDATTHLYKKSCPSVGPSVRLSVRRSLSPLLFSNDKYGHFWGQNVNKWHHNQWQVTMSKDEVVASDAPSRYLLLKLLANFDPVVEILGHESRHSNRKAQHCLSIGGNSSENKWLLVEFLLWQDSIMRWWVRELEWFPSAVIPVSALPFWRQFFAS